MTWGNSTLCLPKGAIDAGKTKGHMGNALVDFGISGLGVLMNSFRGQTRQQHLCHASKPSANGKKHVRAFAP